MGLHLERVRLGAASRVTFDRQAFQEAGKVIVGSTIENILKQRTTTGAKLKQNAPRTLEAKRRKGRPLLSLVDAKRRLVKAKSYRIRAGKRFVEVILSKRPVKQKGKKAVSPAQVAQWVQEMGYIGWFGLHKADVPEMRDVFRRALQRIRQSVQSGEYRRSKDA